MLKIAKQRSYLEARCDGKLYQFVSSPVRNIEVFLIQLHCALTCLVNLAMYVDQQSPFSVSALLVKSHLLGV